MSRFLAALMLALAASPAAADLVSTTDGFVLEGKILEENDQFVLLEVTRVHGGEKVKTRIERARVVKLLRSMDAEANYQERRKLAPAGDWQANFALGTWCAEQGLRARAVEHLVPIFGLEFAKAEAEQARSIVLRLGYRKYPDSGWLPEEEFWQSRGFVIFREAWMTQESAQATEAYEAAWGAWEEASIENQRKSLQSLAEVPEKDEEKLAELVGAWELIVAEDRKKALTCDQSALQTLRALRRAGALTGSMEDLGEVELQANGAVVGPGGRVLIEASLVDRALLMEFNALAANWAKAEAAREELAEAARATVSEILALAGHGEEEEAPAGPDDEKVAELERRLAEADAKLEAARTAMKEKLRADGLPK